MARARIFVVYLVGAGLCLGGAVAVASVLTTPRGGSAPAAPELQPDLVQHIPTDIGARSRGGRFQLGFESAVENHGSGPLLVLGHRSGAASDMSADQVVERSDGSRVYERDIGRLRYTRSPGHEHWHYLGFDRYELRRASDHALVRPDLKTGFCLGDRYDPGRPFPGKPEEAVLEGDCREDAPQATSVAEGISIGYGDDYAAYLEGQSLDITRLPAGLYELVHRANGDRRVRESDHSNNASTVLLRIEWPRGPARKPNVDRVRVCPKRDRCPPA